MNESTTTDAGHGPDAQDPGTQKRGTQKRGTQDRAPRGRTGRESKRQAPAFAKLVGLTAALAAILVVLLGLFILPSLKSGPHGLPLGVVGDAASVSQVEDVLAQAKTDAYDLQHFDSREALASAVEEREVNGGFVVGADGLETIVASAGSTTISGTITATGAQMAKALGSTEVVVSDVVPLPADDPSGIGIGGLAFPLVFGGIVPVVAFRAIFPKSNAWRMTGLVTFAAVGGLVVAAVLRFWFGSIDDAFWAVAGSMALGIAGLALPLAGLQQLFGGKGFTIGAMTMMFLGNPLAGISTTGAWLPTGIGTFGQLLPPGATGSLVRSAAYFGGTGGTIAGLTLTVWVLVGIILHVAASLRSPQTEQPQTEQASTEQASTEQPTGTAVAGATH